MRRDVCVDMHTAMRIDKCIGMRFHVCTDMCIDMCVDIPRCISSQGPCVRRPILSLYKGSMCGSAVAMCVDMCIDMCADMCVDICRHVCRKVSRHVCRQCG